MAGTIIPMVHGNDIRRHRWMPVLVHGAGLLLGSGALGLFLISLGAISGAGRFFGRWPMASSILAGACAAALSGRELGIISLALPESRWQVPRRWRLIHPLLICPLVYGIILGATVFTRVGTATVYWLIVFVAMLDNRLLALMIILCFGCGRCVVLVGLLAAATQHDPFKHIAGMCRLQRTVRLINGVMLWCFGMWWWCVAMRLIAAMIQNATL